MKKKNLLFLGFLCLLGFYACTKSDDENKNKEVTSLTEDVASDGRAPDCKCEPIFGSTIFDPNCLVSSSAHGRLDTIQKGFSFTEGPAVDKWGNVFFTDQPNDKIYRWDASSGNVSLFLQGTGRSNGMAFDKKGNLIACADMKGELWSIDKQGNHKVLAKNYNGKLLNGPNDVWINPVTGGMYITDPIFPRNYWAANDPRKTGNPSWPPTHSEQAATGKGGYVYYLAPGSHNLVRVVTEALGWDADGWPNGVVGTPDGKKLYVNKWAGDNLGGTWVFDIRPNGTLTNMKKFIDMGGDGMSMDEKGNIYISNSLGVTAFDPKGKKIFNVPTGGATNNVFAGQNNKLLFITGAVDRITSLKMNVQGVERFYGNGNGHGHH
ncbi:MAG: SMP-30/gluconolactonase/LRE family protein [Chitinophagaceae bacterium]